MKNQSGKQKREGSHWASPSIGLGTPIKVKAEEGIRNLIFSYTPLHFWIILILLISLNTPKRKGKLFSNL